MKALSQPLFASLRGYDRAQLGPDLFSGALIALVLCLGIYFLTARISQIGGFHG